jgi:hypothetical protein
MHICVIVTYACWRVIVMCVSVCVCVCVCEPQVLHHQLLLRMPGSKDYLSIHFRHGRGGNT